MTSGFSRAADRLRIPAKAALLPRIRRRGWTRAGVLIAVALGIVYTIWGSTYLAIAVAIDSAPPMLLMAARFLIAGGVLFVVAERRGDRSGDRVTPRQLWQALVTGGILLVGGTGVMTLAQTLISSGLASLVAATVPLFLALFARGVFGERLSPRAWIGLLVGLAGVALLVSPGGGATAGVLVALAAAAAWAGGSLRSRVADAPRRPMVAASLQMLGGAVVFAVVGVVRGELAELDVTAITPAAWWAFAYLIIAGSIVAQTAYTWLLRNARTTVVSTYAYVNPIVAVTLGWAILGEEVSARMVGAGAVILVAVVLLITGRPGEPVPAQLTSGVDVFAGSSRWRRTRRRLGALPRAARLYRDPGVLPTRDVGYDIATDQAGGQRGQSSA